MALAKRVMEPNDEGSAETMTRLAELITHLIDSGRERSVIAAINALSARGDADAADEVAFLADDAAQVLEIAVLRQAPGETEAEAVAGQAVLFAIPVLLIGDGERAAPVALTNEGADRSALDKAARSFRDAGLIGSEPSLVLTPYLYRVEDLPSDWEGWRRLHRALLDQRQSASSVSDLPVPSEGEEPGPDPLQLRYMLVSVQSALDESDPGPLITGTDDDSERDALIEAWAGAYTEILIAGLDGMWEISVGDPGEPDEAGRDGLELLNGCLLMMGIEEAAGEGQEPGTVSASIVGWRTPNGDLLTIGLEGKHGEFSGAWWVCGENMRGDIEAVREFLESAGVTRVVADEQIYEGEPRCKKCGEPLFPAVTREGLRHTAPDRHDPGSSTTEQSHTLH